jgi:putative tricarboxylic transport membrane protein
MFAGIYYGAYYGGTITSVLVRIPGEAASVMTCIDGHEMARQGRAGPALGIAAIGSFIAGTFGTAGLMLAAPMLARGALAFGPQEYFALVVLGLSMLAIVGGSLLKGLIMGVAGLCFATIGVDPQVGNTRFTLGQIWLLDGIEFLVLAVAFFGVGEVLAQAERGIHGVDERIRVGKAFPTWSELKTCRWPIARGTVIGFLIGVLPGTGATIASFVAYAVEKKCRRRRSASARERSKAWRRPKPRTIRPRQGRWCRCSRSAFPARTRPRSCWGRSSCSGCGRGRRCSSRTLTSSGR